MIQELDWRPGSPYQADAKKVDPVREGLLRFYNGELFQIVTTCDRQKVEGITEADVVQAMVVMFQAFQARYYVVAAVFGAFALFYNPVAPAFSFPGDWQRAVVLASAIPFVASLAWRNARNARTEHND